MDEEKSCPYAFVVPAVQTYRWGYRGNTSLVARMWNRSQEITLNNTNVIIDPSKPYAELWYGDHMNGVNLIKNVLTSEITPIHQFIGNHALFHSSLSPEISSEKDECEQSILPYLLKVLSNDKALSIQSHPDKTTAERLFHEQPTIYRDPNHKPEISLALSDTVESLCGFRPWNDVADAINHITELSNLLGSEWVLSHSKALQEPALLTPEEVAVCLKDTLKGLLKCCEADLAKCFKGLSKNSSSYVKSDKISETVRSALKLYANLEENFPGDVGCLAPFLLNHVVTHPGECLFIRPNVLHAYLRGQIIECMACSDNVIRGGLTPKFKDVDLLLKTLDYSPYSAPLITPHSLRVAASSSSLPSSQVLIYDPQTGDFRLYLIYVPVGSDIETPIKFEGDSAAILTVLQGKAHIKVHGPDGTIAVPPCPLVQGHSLLLAVDCSFTVAHSTDQQPLATAPSNESSIYPPIVFDDILNGREDHVPFIAVVASGGE